VSYPRDLDEYSDEELREEIARREDCRARGVCSYCGKNGNATKCRFKDRHPNRARRSKPDDQGPPNRPRDLDHIEDH
jgi:hypothetical protein